MGLGLVFTLLVSHECAERIENLDLKEKESSLKVLEFIQNLQKQREEEMKSLRFEVNSLRMILAAKTKAKLK